MSRAEMADAWRERRRARRLQTPDLEQGPGIDGFELRKWRKAGVFGADAVQRVKELLKELLDPEPEQRGIPEFARQTMVRCLEGDPGPDLPSAVRAALESYGTEEAAATFFAIHEGGLPWLSPVGQRRLAFLMATSDGELDHEASPTQGEDASGAFALHQALRSGELASLPPAVCARILPWIPMGVIDDLIAAGAVTRRIGPWRTREEQKEQQYLLARLAPEYVERGAARDLGWSEPVDRELFLAGQDIEAEEGTLYDLLQRAADGETGGLRELDDLLPRDLALRLRTVQGGALTGNWDVDILADRGLWRLLTALWEPKAAVNPARSPFHALTALRHAYDLMCARDYKKAAAQVDKLVAFEEGEPHHQIEAWNMRAYLLLLSEELDNALVALSKIAGQHPQAEANLDLVRRRRAIARNDRPHPSNPYLELGLPQRSQIWKQRYRDLRWEYSDDREEAARLNRAMRRIQNAELAEDWSDFFTLPLDHTVFELPSEPPATLVPPIAPMPRRTAARAAADLETVRRRALADLLPTFLNAPRRPDHQHRTTT
ncbi:hypothetical protein ACIF70_18340 [Actinacidiphila glaucinigra]|uniref:hypothetical protein n=1 Tax=Actinacidiphila glaucinigra TaxID=235986 RepID=UPI0037CA6534